MRKYFHDLTNGIKTVFEGMSITLASMFVTPVTVQYPDVDISSVENLKKGYKGPLAGMPDNYRGILDVTMAICTACGLCQKACPIDCIIIDAVKCDKTKVMGTSGKEAVKTRTSARFDIDIGKCMFCGLCVMPCPTGAIYHSNKFEFNQDNLGGLVLRFVSSQEKKQVLKRTKEIGEEVEIKKAEKIAARKAKEQAEARKTNEKTAATKAKKPRPEKSSKDSKIDKTYKEGAE